jgi:hypothetical protein
MVNELVPAIEPQCQYATAVMYLLGHQGKLSFAAARRALNWAIVLSNIGKNRIRGFPATTLAAAVERQET